MNNFGKIAVTVPQWAIPRWWLVAYKIVGPLDQRYTELVDVPVDARFERTVSKYVSDYVNEGKLPAADIAPAILNLSNDLLNGREMIIRTGDYITIQNHIRNLKAGT
jgi:hypothetical protein